MRLLSYALTGKDACYSWWKRTVLRAGSNIKKRRCVTCAVTWYGPAAYFVLLFVTLTVAATVTVGLLYFLFLYLDEGEVSLLFIVY